MATHCQGSILHPEAPNVRVDGAHLGSISVSATVWDRRHSFELNLDERELKGIDVHNVVSYAREASVRPAYRQFNIASSSRLHQSEFAGCQWNDDIVMRVNVVACLGARRKAPLRDYDSFILYLDCGDCVHDDCAVRPCSCIEVFIRLANQALEAIEPLLSGRASMLPNVCVQPPPKAVGCDALLCGIGCALHWPSIACLRPVAEGGNGPLTGIQ